MGLGLGSGLGLGLGLGSSCRATVEFEDEVLGVSSFVRQLVDLELRAW